MEPDLIAIKLTTTILAYPPRPVELTYGGGWGAATHMSISGSTRSNLRDFYLEMHEPDEHDE